MAAKQSPRRRDVATSHRVGQRHARRAQQGVQPAHAELVAPQQHRAQLQQEGDPGRMVDVRRRQPVGPQQVVGLVAEQRHGAQPPETERQRGQGQRDQEQEADAGRSHGRASTVTRYRYTPCGRVSSMSVPAHERLNSPDQRRWK